MFAIVGDHYNRVTLKNNTWQESSIKVLALMNSVHNTFHYADMTDDMTFIYSESLGLRLSKCAERV
jgi:hypothetical protein